jgi:hypothetical protein
MAPDSARSEDLLLSVITSLTGAVMTYPPIYLGGRDLAGLKVASG